MPTMSNNNNPVLEPVVMTFRLSPDVMDEALPHIKYLSALQGHLTPTPEPVGVYAGPERRRRRPTPAEVPTYGEERMPKDEARATLPEDHEGVTVEEGMRRRGRIPGLYKLVDNVEVDPEQLTPSALAIYRVMQARVHKAATAVEIADRLRMSSGTVGWALAELRKVRLVEYLPRAGNPATSRKPKTPH